MYIYLKKCGRGSAGRHDVFPSSVVKSLLQAWRPTRLVSDRFLLQQRRRLSRHCHRSCTGFLFSARSLCLSAFQYCVIFAAASESLLFLLLLSFLHQLLQQPLSVSLHFSCISLPQILLHSFDFFSFPFSKTCVIMLKHISVPEPCPVTQDMQEKLWKTSSWSLLKCNFFLKPNCTISTSCNCHTFFFHWSVLNSVILRFIKKTLQA